MSDNQSSMNLKLDNYTKRSPDRNAKAQPKSPISDKHKEILAITCWEKCKHAYVKRMTSSALLSDFEETQELESEAYINMWNILNKFDIQTYKYAKVKGKKGVHCMITDLKLAEVFDKIPPFHTEREIVRNKKGEPVVDKETGEVRTNVVPFSKFERIMFENIFKIVMSYQRGKIKDFNTLNEEYKVEYLERKEKVTNSTRKMKKAVLKKATKKDCPLYHKLGLWIKDKKELDKSYNLIKRHLKEEFYDVPGQGNPKTTNFYFLNYYYTRVNLTAREARQFKKTRGTGPVDGIGGEIEYGPEARDTDYNVDPQYNITANLTKELKNKDYKFRRFFTEMFILRRMHSELRQDYGDDFKSLKENTTEFIRMLRKKYDIDYSGADSKTG